MNAPTWMTCCVCGYRHAADEFCTDCRADAERFADEETRNYLADRDTTGWPYYIAGLEPCPQDAPAWGDIAGWGSGEEDAGC